MSLHSHFQVPVSGAVDLQHLAQRLGITANTSLEGLTREIVGLCMKKSRSVRRSNWEAQVLSATQVTYAGCDAIAALLIMERLVADKISEQRCSGFCGEVGHGGGTRSVLECDEGVSHMHTLCQGLVSNAEEYLHRQLSGKLNILCILVILTVDEVKKLSHQKLKPGY